MVEENERLADERDRKRQEGRALHSSTFQLNRGRFLSLKR